MGPALFVAGLSRESAQRSAQARNCLVHFVLFLASGALVVAAGALLARNADVIAETTGLGRLWTGSILLATASSLPELATDVAAVRLDAADLAAGDLFGSSLANMLVLAIVDLSLRHKQVLRSAALDHALAASLAISLNALAVVLVLVRPESTVWRVGPGAILLVFAYVTGTRVIYRQARRNRPTADSHSRAIASSRVLRRSAWGFTLATLLILAAAPVFAWSAREIATITGLGTTVVGTWLVGLATSLPELASSITAVRLGALDMAVGNLFGSNAFNMAIFFVLDLAEPGSFFAVLDPSHALSGLFAVVMMCLGMAAIVYRAEKRFAMIEPGSILMIAAYLLAIGVLYSTAP
jgi:cation:H+ antiporter